MRFTVYVIELEFHLYCKTMRPILGILSSAVFVLSLIRGRNGEIFSSTALLSESITTQREIIGQLQTYVEDSDAKISRIRNFIDAFDRILEPTDVDEVSRNPLSAYKLIKQLAVHWQSVENLLNESSWQGLIQQVLSHGSSSLMPNLEDVEGAALAILRLQETYQLNASDLARGNILGIQSSIRLTTEDCMYLGKKSFTFKLFGLAIEWYDLALRMSREQSNPIVAPQKIRQYLDEAIKKHNTVLENEEKSTSTKYKLGVEISEEDGDRNYKALCRGEQLTSDSDRKSLSCYLSDRNDASFYINPIKVEVHSHDPQIVTFHDVIYESEINFIQKFSTPSLKRSEVYAENASKEVTNGRISHNTWLYDDEEDEKLRRKLKSIMDRLSRITGLKIHGTGNSEAMQVANYGIGGHYLPHWDFLYVDLPPEEFASWNPVMYQTFGDRIATLMFYLSDVQLGGATVFPLIGAAVWPRKGSAAFWYNIHKNCDADRRTLHGGCPVLHGSKWIGNKWIREVNQVFKRPCSLNPND